MPKQSDIDRLIELGLNRYGAGEIDEALLMWEQALAADPDNPQANSYVDYVRSNYELLTSGEPALVDDPSYALDEEPDYQIEILPGELPRPSQPLLSLADEELDAGWDLEETQDAGGPMQRNYGDSFDEDEGGTREYYNAANPPSDFAAESETSEFQQREVTGSFQNEGTPVGFAQQETSVRQRELGFVKPQGAPQPVQDKPSSPMAIGTASTVELGAALEAAGDNNPFAEVTLDRSLENQQTKETVLPKRSTRDQLEQSLRPPARRTSEELSQAEVMLPHAPTQDFDGHGRIDVGAPTRELGLRPPARLSNPVDEDAPTGEADVRAIREAAGRREGNARPVSEGTRHDIVLQFDPIAARSAQVLAEVDADAPPDEPKEEQTRRRITMLLQKAIEYNAAHETDKAVTAVDLALAEDPNSALGQKLVTRNKDTIMQIFQSFIGDLDRQPHLARPLHELAKEPISPRAAFLLSRIDGTLTVDELLDVSGMPRLEAYRHLCQLFLRGILR
ncbi:MAG TPA: hypothetical protein VMZ53_13900 [Kofleriaceae bacterium]|nr:hypothetical protein [Kofleriaceae bacterium]